MREKVEQALEDIRPSLQMDGGGIELVSVEDGIIKVRLTGACGGCSMSQITMTQGVEQAIKKSVPEVKKVIAVLKKISLSSIGNYISKDLSSPQIVTLNSSSGSRKI